MSCFRECYVFKASHLNLSVPTLLEIVKNAEEYNIKAIFEDGEHEFAAEFTAGAYTVTVKVWESASKRYTMLEVEKVHEVEDAVDKVDSVTMYPSGLPSGSFVNDVECPSTPCLVYIHFNAEKGEVSDVLPVRNPEAIMRLINEVLNYAVNKAHPF